MNARTCAALQCQCVEIDEKWHGLRQSVADTVIDLRRMNRRSRSTLIDLAVHSVVNLHVEHDAPPSRVRLYA